MGFSLLLACVVLSVLYNMLSNFAHYLDSEEEENLDTVATVATAETTTTQSYYIFLLYLSGLDSKHIHTAVNLAHYDHTGDAVRDFAAFEMSLETEVEACNDVEGVHYPNRELKKHRVQRKKKACKWKLMVVLNGFTNVEEALSFLMLSKYPNHLNSTRKRSIPTVVYEHITALTTSSNETLHGALRGLIETAWLTSNQTRNMDFGRDGLGYAPADVASSYRPHIFLTIHWGSLQQVFKPLISLATIGIPCTEHTDTISV